MAEQLCNIEETEWSLLGSKMHFLTLDYSDILMSRV